ncbi:MAG: efflux RND transporter periplasmic adaptor subunit [Oceanococcaceae bacterium]
MSTTHQLAHPYLRFAGASAEPREDLHGRYVRVISVRSNQVLRLLPEEHTLAMIFDGKRTAAERLQKAQALRADITAMDLEAFAAELSESELLFAGTEEPLPVPPQTDHERRQAHLHADARSEEAFPPATEPGSLSGHSSLGPLAGSVWRGRVNAERIDWPLHPGFWAGLGRLFAWPLIIRGGTLLLGLLVLVLLWALWDDQALAQGDVLRLLAWQNLMAVGVPMALLTNLLAESSRAWMIHRETGRWPRFGIIFAMRVIPRFLCDTEGAAEHVSRAGRLRIVAAPLVSGFALFALALLLWFITRLGTTMLPAALITAALFGMGNALLRLNPLARTDGYYLLSAWLGVADLREQSFLALLGIKLRWGNRTPPPRAPMAFYALAVLAFFVTLVTLILLYPARWLESQYGGAAVGLLLIGVTVYSVTLARRYRDQRTQLQRAPWQPSIDRGAVALTRYGLRFGLIAVVALWPYTYEPGGRVVLQPQDRAEITAGVSAFVESVMVKEGDWVEEGATLAQLDTALIRAEIASTEAEIAAQRARLDEARNGATAEDIAQAEQRVVTAEARLRYSEAEARRADEALKRRAITSQERDAARNQADLDREVLALEQASLTRVRTPAREENVREIESQIRALEADLDYQQTALERMTVTAPIDGYVVGAQLRFLTNGFVDSGETFMVIENTRELQAELRLPEFAASEVTPGMAAVVKVWALPGQGVPAVVTDVAPVAEAGENGRILRVQLRLTNPDGVLYSEMSGQAKVEGRTMPLIVAYTRAILRFVMVEVWSWLP